MSTKSSAPIRRLYCSCCGEGAGRWHQHWNMDTGFGACVRCITFMRRRGETEEELLSRYGTEGVNWGMSIQMYGLVFRVVAAFPEREEAYANEWMSKHETHALLAIHEGLLLLADINDRGAKPSQDTPKGSPPPVGNLRVFPVPRPTPTDPAGALHIAASAMLAAFGSNVPDWLRNEFAALDAAVKDYEMNKENNA